MGTKCDQYEERIQDNPDYEPTNEERECVGGDYRKYRRLIKQQTKTAWSGWSKILMLGIVGLFALAFAFQMATGVPVFDALSGSGADSGFGYAIVSIVFLVVIYMLYVLWKDCDFEFACFLTGGNAGQKKKTMSFLRRSYKREATAIDRQVGAPIREDRIRLRQREERVDPMEHSVGSEDYAVTDFITPRTPRDGYSAMDRRYAEEYDGVSPSDPIVGTSGWALRW